MSQRRQPIPIPVESRIFVLRHHKVILDSDLAGLYAVQVKRLNQQVKRNQGRFPSDFMFQMSVNEYKKLRSQFVTSNPDHGGRRYRPYAFTEHGAVMAATLLNSERAVRMSIVVVRAFVHLRDTLASNRELAVKVGELELHLETHDDVIRDLFREIKKLTSSRKAPHNKLGFQLPDANRLTETREKSSRPKTAAREPIKLRFG
jgi:ORF6N domain-containing protein